MITNPQWPRLLPVGDSGLVVEFGDEIDPAINGRVHALAHLLTLEPLTGVVELIPTYRSLLIRYDPLALTYGDIAEWARGKSARADSMPPIPTRWVEVPTIYGGDFGPDLEFVAQHNHLSTVDVIRIHSGTEYTVYMMGFTPGYPYMGKINPAIAVPRLETPRTRVRAGSVGIAGLQTGIYPIESPGGWRIIGFTPLTLFNPSRAPPFLFAPGDTVRFVPTTKDELTHVTPGN